MSLDQQKDLRSVGRNNTERAWLVTWWEFRGRRRVFEDSALNFLYEFETTDCVL